MKAVLLDRYGPPERLRLADVPTPQPKAGEVLVKVHASSVNSWDWDLLTGAAIVRMGAPFRPRYKILGADLAGTVAAVGPGVTRFREGDAVFGDISESGWGCFAEYATARADLLAAKPAAMSFADAAAMPQAGTLALQGLLRGKRPIKAGDHVAINGSGGGVGSFAVQLAKAEGAEVTAIDSAMKQELMRDLGADHLLDYAAADYTAVAGRYDFILDMVANRSRGAYAAALKPGGRLAVVGGNIPALLRFGIGGAIASGAEGRSYGLVLWKPNAADLETLAALYAEGKVKPAIERVYPLAEVPAALQQIGDGKVLGKLVIGVADAPA